MSTKYNQNRKADTLRETLTKETVIKTNLATIGIIIVGLIGVVGAWTTAMINISYNSTRISDTQAEVDQLKLKVDETREAFFIIQGDLKEIKARL